MPDRHHPGYTDTAQFTRYEVKRQAVDNQAWPDLDIARRLRDVPVERQVQVWARIVLELDGEHWTAGRAVRWAQGCVCVLAADRRLWTPYVWVDAADIRRRTLPA
jgi:hypothetical protein